MQKSRKFNKIFTKNMFIITSFFLIFIIIAISLFAVFKYSAREEKIKMLETDSLNKTGAIATNTFYHIASSIMHFSTRNYFIDKNDQQKNQVQIYSVQKEMKSAMATFNAIEGIRIIERNSGYAFHDGFAAPETFELGKTYGKIGNVKICENLNEDSFRLIMAADSGEYLSNEVYFGVNTEYLAENVLLNNSDFRTEYFVDLEGNILISEKKSHINKNIRDIYDFDIPLNNDSSQVIKDNGKNLIVSTIAVENLDFYVVSLADLSIYSSIDSENNLLFILIIIAFGICGVLMAFFIFKVTYRPIQEILNQFGSFAKIDKKSMDEVQYINQNIRNLTASNDELSDLVDEKIEELTTSHIAALQAQICPHFINNTLEAINWISYDLLNERKNPISRAITNMSLLYKSTMNISEIFRSIDEECKFTECYLEILHIRRPGVYSVEWNVDEHLRNYHILKLSIQPLIENIANHARGNGSEKIQIKIFIQDAGDAIKVTVCDDGVGISPERLAEIRQTINDFGGGEKHLGLRNINERLQLLYGEEYSINIYSTEGKETVISFIYPKGFSNDKEYV